jgi:hypothetical protein
MCIDASLKTRLNLKTCSGAEGLGVDALSIRLPGNAFIVAKTHPLFSTCDLSSTHQLYPQTTYPRYLLTSSKRFHLTAMATKTLEARFEHLALNDENEAPLTGSAILKSKVRNYRRHESACDAELWIASSKHFGSSCSTISGKNQSCQVCSAANDRVEAQCSAGDYHHDDNHGSDTTSFTSSKTGPSF